MEDPSDEPPQRPSDAGAIMLIDPYDALDEPARSWLERCTTRLVDALSLRGDVRVKLLVDAEMSVAHERYKGIAGPTDVLTFDLSDEDGDLDVDLLVCTDEAHRRAADFDHGFEAEILLYIIHGILHCTGYDDHEEADAVAMHEAEDSILSEIGVGPVYAPRKGMAS